jgi:acyl-CoA synthetase (NDP forming)
MWRISPKTSSQSSAKGTSVNASKIQPLVLKRFLHLHEYQSQNLMKQYKINVPAGEAVSTPEEAYKIAKDLGKFLSSFFL